MSVSVCGPNFPIGMSIFPPVVTANLHSMREQHLGGSHENRGNENLQKFVPSFRTLFPLSLRPTGQGGFKSVNTTALSREVNFNESTTHFADRGQVTLSVSRGGRHHDAPCQLGAG